MQQPRLSHWALLGFLSIAWGFAFYLIAVALGSFGPITIVAIRLSVGTLTLYVLMRWQGHRLPPLGPWWPRFTILAIFGNALPFSLIAWAETRISSAQAGLLMALMPISTMVLSHYFVAGDGLTRRKLVGVMLGFLGVAVLVGGDVLGGHFGGELFAQLVVLAATLSYAANTVYTKRVPEEINVLVMAVGALLVGSMILLPISLALEQPQLTMAVVPDFMAALLLGVVSTGLATWAYFKVVTDCGPSFLSLINYIIPAIAFSAGVLFLNEQAHWTQFFGLAIVLLGIGLTQKSGRN
ncbi:MAG: DMT family transporter [Halioglobus sp.]